MLKIKQWIYFSLRIRVQQHSHVHRADLCASFFHSVKLPGQAAVSYSDGILMYAVSLLTLDAYVFVSLSDFLLHFRDRTGYGNIWSVHSSLGARWGLLSLSDSLAIIYSRMQKVVKQGYTHTTASLFTHTCTPVRAHTHTCTITFHMIKVCLFLSLCSVHKLARRRVSVIRTCSQAYQLILP